MFHIGPSVSCIRSHRGFYTPGRRLLTILNRTRVDWVYRQSPRFENRVYRHETRLRSARHRSAESGQRRIRWFRRVVYYGYETRKRKFMAVTEAYVRRIELARRGDEIYESAIRPVVGDQDAGKYALIDVVTGEYEIDDDELAASDRLLARCPEAQVWLRQVGASNARRFGIRPMTSGTPEAFRA
jgi:hypothetical protein